MPDDASPSLAASNIPTVGDVQQIAALDDPIVRNLQITQCYHELSAAVAQLLPQGANWCTVATWASRQAGQSIRREDLREALERLIQGSDEVDEAATALEVQSAAAMGDNTESLAGAAEALKDALSPAAAFDRVSNAVAAGNQKVFAEVGLIFADFLTLFSAGLPTDATVAQFCSGLKPGIPPDGQDYLRRAFTHYYEAIIVPDDKARAELMLLANLEIGFHEQTRLQPDIRRAMDAPIFDPADLRQALLRELFPDLGSRLRLAVLSLSDRARPLFAARDRLAEEAQQLGRQVVTEHLMTLELPVNRHLRLGHDLKGPIPPALQSITIPELRDLLIQVGLPPDGNPDQRATDWSVLPERMRFIAELFRTCQFDKALFTSPFTTGEVVILKAGRRPAGL